MFLLLGIRRTAERRRRKCRRSQRPSGSVHSPGHWRTQSHRQRFVSLFIDNDDENEKLATPFFQVKRAIDGLVTTVAVGEYSANAPLM